jgi:MFS family permease
MTGEEGRIAGGLARYGSFLGRADVLRLIVSSILARLPGGMVQLAVVLAIQHRSSLAAAGTAAAALAVASAVAGPFRGRAADRVGARRVLLTSGIAQGAGLLGLTAAITASAPVAIDILLSAVIGLSTPPVNPVMRTIWSRKFSGATRRTAFSLESVLLDLTYIVGPAIVAITATAASPAWVLVLTGLMCVCGCLMLAMSPESRDWPVASSAPRHWLGAWRSASLRRLLPLGFFITGSITVIELALVAFARSHGQPSSSGYLIALFSVGSMAGGLCYGTLNLRARALRQLAVVTAFLGVGYLLSALASSVVVLGVIITITGLFLAPSITLEYAAVDEVVDPGAATESFALLNSAGQGGSAVGAVLAGFAGQHVGEQAVFGTGAVMVVIAAVLAAGIRVPGHGPMPQPSAEAESRPSAEQGT